MQFSSADNSLSSFEIQIRCLLLNNKKWWAECDKKNAIPMLGSCSVNCLMQKHEDLVKEVYILSNFSALEVRG
jgi:hypothetical protein